MKIWCDVCSKKQASFFCSSDEASLCHGCDSRVHQANKLASKHRRFFIFQPSISSHLPRCDICQEKKGVLFCQQDRAILCSDCDGSLHSANELTLKHHRFLLTGAKLSSAQDLTESGSDLVPDFNSNATQMDLISHDVKHHRFQLTGAKLSSTKDLTETGFDLVPDFKSNATQMDLISQATNDVKHLKFQLTEAKLTESEIDLVPDFNSKATQMEANVNQGSINCGSTSSIFEYLMEMLPGWQVEDLMNSSFSDTKVFDCNDDGEDDDNSNGLWVPQAPIMPSMLNPGFCVLKNGAEVAKGDDFHGRKASEYVMDDGFIVPQIRPSVKRFRHAY